MAAKNGACGLVITSLLWAGQTGAAHGDNAVCKAFAKVVEQMQPDQAPACNRIEPPTRPGFSPLHRAFLASGDTYVLSEQLVGFAEHSSSQYFETKRAETDKWCADPTHAIACKPILAEKQRVLAEGGKWFEPYTKDSMLGATAWRYEPALDIDNDGLPDPVLLLTKNRCGAENYKGAIEGSATYAYIMDRDYKLVDDARTRRVFGHPIPQWPKGLESDRFRYVGNTLGIFVFEDKTYFYSLLDSAADFAGKQVGDASLAKTIGVFLNERGNTRSVCELPFGK
jgi:hypothetical protein